jgi:hypothetical protein
VEPTNEQLKQALQEAEEQEQASGGGPDIGNVFGQMLQGDIWTKLRQSDLTRAYLDDPAFVSLLSRLQKNPNELPMYIHACTLSLLVLEAANAYILILFRSREGTFRAILALPTSSP